MSVRNASSSIYYGNIDAQKWSLVRTNTTPTNMWATPTTTPWYALMKEQLQKETWTPYTWSFANSKCRGGMWVPQSKFPSQFISCLEISVCPRILLSIKKRKKMNERSCHGDNIESSSTKCHGKYSQCPAFDIKQSPAGRSQRITRFVLMLISLLNKAQLCFLYLFLYALVWMYVATYIHRRFRLSMVLRLKCLLWSNWHGVKFDWWTSELILV